MSAPSSGSRPRSRNAKGRSWLPRTTVRSSTRVVGRVWELRDRRLTAFRGNYAAFLSQREERDARARKDSDTLKDQIEREKELVQRYRSHRKYSKMHEHERRLEALQVQASDVPTKHRAGVLTLGGFLNGGAKSAPARSGEVVIGLEGLAAGYDSKPIVRVERLEARRGSRIGLVGPNGSGKTTLMRTIAGDLAPIDGRLMLGQKVQVGYLAQIRRLPMPGTTVLEALTAGSGLDEGPARSYLARFLFRGDDAFKPVANLSGGERSRLELALVGLQAANLLLLDEPTNHLDIPAREALESFLREAAGTVIVVSHDRRLLEAVCNELWVVEARDHRHSGACRSLRRWLRGVARSAGRRLVGRGSTQCVATRRRQGCRQSCCAAGCGTKEVPSTSGPAAVEGRLSPPPSGCRGRPDPPRAAQDSARAGPWRLDDPGQLRRAAPGVERAGRRRCRARPGRGCLADAGRAGAALMHEADGSAAAPRAVPRPFMIGLTGPIGCGKSTVAQMLGELGGTVIDADVLARRATEPGRPTLPPIRDRFGESVFTPEGTLDRAALAAIVFDDDAALSDLEAIVHPEVRRLVDAELAAAAGGRGAVGDRRGDQAGRGRPGPALRRGLAGRVRFQRLSASGWPVEAQRSMTSNAASARRAPTWATAWPAPLPTDRPFVGSLPTARLTRLRSRVEDALADALAPLLLDLD